MGGGVGGGSTFVVGGALSSFKSAQQFLFQTTKGWEGGVQCGALLCNDLVTRTGRGQIVAQKGVHNAAYLYSIEYIFIPHIPCVL